MKGKGKMDFAGCSDKYVHEAILEGEERIRKEKGNYDTCFIGKLNEGGPNEERRFNIA